MRSNGGSHQEVRGKRVGLGGSGPLAHYQIPVKAKTHRCSSYICLWRQTYFLKLLLLLLFHHLGRRSRIYIILFTRHAV